MIHQMTRLNNNRFKCPECGRVVKYDPVERRLKTVEPGNPNVPHKGAVLLERDDTVLVMGLTLHGENEI